MWVKFAKRNHVSRASEGAVPAWTTVRLRNATHRCQPELVLWTYVVQLLEPSGGDEPRAALRGKHDGSLVLSLVQGWVCFALGGGTRAEGAAVLYGFMRAAPTPAAVSGSSLLGAPAGWTLPVSLTSQSISHEQRRLQGTPVSIIHERRKHEQPTMLLTGDAPPPTKTTSSSTAERLE